MWFDGIRQPNTLYIANTSRGKDSTAMLRAIELMGWPLDMICAVDIWATQDIPAELPPLVAFKDDYDRKVFDWFGIPVTRLCATKRESCTRVSYSDIFYSELSRGKFTGTIKGFPMVRGSWCKHLKTSKVDLRGYILSQAQAQERERERRERSIYGFPQVKGNWCNSDLKRAAFTVGQLRRAAGVPGNSSGEYYRLPLAERCMVSGQAQGQQPRQSFPNCPRTRGKR